MNIDVIDDTLGDGNPKFKQFLRGSTYIQILVLK
jgi:hypothetical protein